MSENARPPQVAIRIVRPYQTEEEFLSNELETVGKTSVILIGAHPRPAGVILRFEVVLGSGATVLRGEGRVLAHKESAFRGQPGLSLRFTRLDPKSKALVDRAAAMREARLSGEAPSIRPSQPTAEPPVRSAPPPPAPAHEPVPVPISFPAPAPSDPALESALTAPTPEPPSHEPIEETPTPPPLERSIAAASPSIEAPISSVSIPISVQELESEPSSERPSEPAVAAAPTRDSVPEPAREAPPPPKDREGILARLRERASSLSRERVEEILSAKKS